MKLRFLIRLNKTKVYTDIDMYIFGVSMAKQIMVSNEVYRLLSKNKKNKSFSDVIKMLLKSKEQKRPKASSLAGLLKNDKKLLKLKKKP
ncbi:VapB antitoxin [Candidatus Mancarchaeum acidiphilum]|uniref:VapB antitoxin n=2 Tax=Candidatus Mancarchaeum acidiphilum TaxID=1920749 RepID=A0A218NMS8_9ARCH|nr:VapB antitoxin [Candidatus Mancarchaeum acidiphilum]